MTRPALARGCGFGSGQQLDERTFAGAVHAYQPDAVAAIDNEIYARENLLIPIALRDVAKLGRNAPARRRLRERKVDCLFFIRQLDTLNLLQLLDPALH